MRVSIEYGARRKDACVGARGGHLPSDQHRRPYRLCHVAVARQFVDGRPARRVLQRPYAAAGPLDGPGRVGHSLPGSCHLRSSPETAQKKDPTRAREESVTSVRRYSHLSNPRRCRGVRRNWHRSGQCGRMVAGLRRAVPSASLDKSSAIWFWRSTDAKRCVRGVSTAGREGTRYPAVPPAARRLYAPPN